MIGDEQSSALSTRLGILLHKLTGIFIVMLGSFARNIFAVDDDELEPGQ